MSEIKLNPKTITIDEVFRFVDTLDLNKLDGLALKTMIGEVSQKPLQEIVETLENKIDNKLYNPNWNAGIIAAISVVEHIGGIQNER